jgi:plasmid stabilization system protein ParE
LTRVVRVAQGARGDIIRLLDFLVERDVTAAGRARETLATALASLAELPDRGRPISGSYRELPVKFGRYGYAIRYRVTPDEVFVSRIFHTRERR